MEPQWAREPFGLRLWQLNRCRADISGNHLSRPRQPSRARDRLYALWWRAVRSWPLAARSNRDLPSPAGLCSQRSSDARFFEI